MKINRKALLFVGTTVVLAILHVAFDMGEKLQDFNALFGWPGNH